MYASLGRRLFEAKELDAALEIIVELKEKLRARIPSIDEVKALFPEIVYAERLTKQRWLVKYILSGMERNLRSGTIVDYEKMTIEHIVLQSEIGEGDLTEAVVGQIGNLILVSQEMNSRLSHKPFQEKLRILKAANFQLPNEIAGADKWTAKDIRTRTDAIASQAYKKIWKI